MQSLTKRQQEVLQFICENIRENQYPPTIREICAHMGIRSTNGANDHLKALEKKGYISRQGQKSRTLQVSEHAFDAVGMSNGTSTQNDGYESHNSNSGDSSHASTHDGAVSYLHAHETTAIPLLGRIAAGTPILAEEHIEEYIHVDPALFGHHKSSDVFALRVVGVSMINDGILDNDIIFIEKKQQAHQGEIVAVLVDDEATVKRFYREENHIRLQPANDAMEPIIIAAHEFKKTAVLGRVVGLYRNIN